MKKPLVTLPSVQQVARNALKAHKAGRLQATSRGYEIVDCKYYDPITKCRCVLGASIPPRIGQLLDENTGAGFVELVDQGLVALSNPRDFDALRYLQRLHDGAIGSVAERKQGLLTKLREYAQ